MKDLMIDIETLGTSHNAVVTQIGALKFNRETGETDKGICLNVSIDDCLRLGLEVDAGALKFWWENVPSFLEGAMPVGKAVQILNEYCKGAEAVWSHATFDMPILANMCLKVGQKKLPFPYRNCRDIRTLVDIPGVKMDKEEKKIQKTHNALEDCVYQVKYCVRCFRALKGKE